MLLNKCYYLKIPMKHFTTLTMVFDKWILINYPFQVLFSVILNAGIVLT